MEITQNSLNNWKTSKVDFNGPEAILLVSLHNWLRQQTGNVLLLEDEIIQLRFIIYCFSRHQLGEGQYLELGLGRLKVIEKNLPLFGLVDESIFITLRTKLNKAILELQTVIYEDPNQDAIIRSLNELYQKGIDNVVFGKDFPEKRTRKKRTPKKNES